MKKFMCVLLTMALALTAVTAFAATPSKTTANTTRVVRNSAEGQGVLVFVTEDAEEVLAEIAKVFTAVNTDGMAPIEYFPEDVQAAVAALLPEGFDLKTLELNEFVTVDQSGYTDALGDVTAYFEFATPYAVGQKLVMLLGFYSGEKDAQDNYEVEWVALAAEVQEDGLVAVTIPAECMVKMQTSKAVAAAVLSEPVAE